MRKLAFYLWFPVAFAIACKVPSKREANKEFVKSTWGSLNPNEYPDWQVVDSFRFNMILRNDDGTVDSIPMKYKIDEKNFYIYTYAFLASTNKILRLTRDTFIYCRPNDKDTFAFARIK